MKLLSLVVFSVFITFASCFWFTPEFKQEFDEYKVKFNKSYDNLFAEFIAMLYYKNCTEFIKIQNENENLTFTLAPTHFCDQDPELIKNFTAVNFRPPPLVESRALTYVDPKDFPTGPPSIDWRDSGCITRVKDESYYCNSCYAFSAAAALEAHWCLKNNISVSLSEQMIVDCSIGFYGNKGCSGGSQGASWTYIETVSDGIESDSTYPFIQLSPNIKQNCKFNRSRAVATANGYYRIQSKDAQLLRNALAAVGPFAASMNGGYPTFWYYSDGIYSDPNCKPSKSHSVLIVGYGFNDSVNPPMPYWICKNSWSEDFGDGGYFKILAGKNICGIEDQLVYPSVPDIESYTTTTTTTTTRRTTTTTTTKPSTTTTTTTKTTTTTTKPTTTTTAKLTTTTTSSTTSTKPTTSSTTTQSTTSSTTSQSTTTPASTQSNTNSTTTQSETSTTTTPLSTITTTTSMTTSTDTTPSSTNEEPI